MTAKKYTDYMYNLIKRIVDEAGPREPCSKAETKAAAMFANEWKPICDNVLRERFTCSPTAFLGFFPLLALMYIISAALYWVFPPASFAVAFIGFLILVIQFVRYKELLDPIWPTGERENVSGIIKPKGEVKRRLIICGHIDSAYEFNLWLFLKNAAIPVMIVGIVAVLLLVGASLAKSIAMFGPGDPAAEIYKILGIATIALYPLVGLFIFFHTYVPVPGAMDDIAGISIAAGLGRYLDDNKKNGGFFPENTEVVLLAMGCEEAGLRGAMRYVPKHLKEMKDIPTHVLIFDGICDETNMAVIKAEICTGAKHDRKLVRLVQDICKKHNWKLKTTVIPLGASDATVFSRHGISATCFLCQDTAKLVPNYHTRHDTIDKINPESLTRSLQVAIDALESIDKKGL